MAGKAGRSGRPAKAIALHVTDGTFREDRHAGGAPVIAGDVVKPDFLDPVASDFWDRLAPKLIAVNVLTPADVESLQSCCDVWALWRKTHFMLMEDPTDKDTRIAASTYLGLFNAIAARFGLNPSDRARLKIEKPAPVDPLDSLLKKRKKSS